MVLAASLGLLGEQDKNCQLCQTTLEHFRSPVGGVEGEQGAEYHREDERDSGKEEALRRLSKMLVELDRSEATRERGYTTALFKLMRPHLMVMCACWQWSLQAVLRVDVTRYLLLVGTCGQPLGVEIIQSETYSSDGLVDCGGTSNFVCLLFPGRSTLRCPGPCLISCIHALTRVVAAGQK